MAASMLLKPTLHVEVLLRSKQEQSVIQDICNDIARFMPNMYANCRVGQVIVGFDRDDTPHVALIDSIIVADYTGPNDVKGFHQVSDVELDVQSYALKSDRIPAPRRRISQPEGGVDAPEAQILLLPNVMLKDEWASLIYDSALPSQLLRYLTRMLGVMKQPGLNLSVFNWNRLCLLHGPPGSGKSTLCRALAQKLSIRLSRVFPQAVLVEVNTNSMLSKYFGESGKLIGALFEKICSLAQSSTTLICVIMDEVETIAGSREKVTAGGECGDSMRATNQLLTALDRVRSLPNIIVLCTSNLINAIDPAFIDRVDIKQLIPSPSPEAIYNIFRSCLNELIRAHLVNLNIGSVSAKSSIATRSSSSDSTAISKRRALSPTAASTPVRSPPRSCTLMAVPTIPTFADMQITYHDQPDSPCQRVWALAQKCEGFSGRLLRRLPILGLAMHTWGGDCSLQDAVSALAAAVNDEIMGERG